MGQSERGLCGGGKARPSLQKCIQPQLGWKCFCSAALCAVAPGGCREGLAAALGRALHVQPPVPPVSPLPPSAFPVPPSAAVMATGVSRATAEPALIGGCQAGRMEVWAALRCSQVSRTRRMEWGAGNPQISHSPCSHLGQGSPGQGGHGSGWGCPYVFLAGTPAWLPSWLCWGRGHAWDTTLDPGPLQRAPHGCLLRGKATEGSSQGSREQHGNAAGKGMLWGNSTGGGTGWEVGVQLHQWLVHT